MDDARRRILEAFAPNMYPADAYVVGSRQGDEPEEEAGAFRGRTDWRAIEPSFLDDHADALHFFTEAGLRFFLPAFLLADLDGRLERADPVFTLTHGFSDAVVEVRSGGRVHRRTVGGSALVNPRLYGAMTFHDHACARLSVFCREEAAAIATYLRAARDTLAEGTTTHAVDAALERFWLDRAERAPTRGDLDEHERTLQGLLADPVGHGDTED